MYFKDSYRGMCGHLVHLKIRMETFLELTFFCPKLAKDVAIDKKKNHNKYEVLDFILFEKYANKNDNAFLIT